MTDPFDQLASPIEARRPRVAFVRELRSRLVAELGLDAADDADGSALVSVPTVDLPPRRSTMPTTDTSDTTDSSASGPLAAVAGATVVPYLAVAGATEALAFYTSAFGAVEHHRVVGPDGKVGHAEMTIGDARFYLSDAYPEIGVASPTDLGGTAVSLHLDVSDVDALFARAVEAGATALTEPADQAHGARHGTLVDPYGHRWMISQQLVDLDLDRYAEQMGDDGWTVTPGAGTSEPAPAAAPADRAAALLQRGGIWPAINAEDAPALIRFLTDVLGFTEELVVPDAEPGKVAHSQLRWPEGGTVQVASAGRAGNLFSQRPTGSDSLYVITEDPEAVLARCRQAGAEMVAEPAVPEYDPGGKIGFTIADPEGNLWSFGSYAGEG